jgi:hypothetical protein
MSPVRKNSLIKLKRVEIGRLEMLRRILVNKRARSLDLKVFNSFKVKKE